jgi:hypothetical protein
MMCDRCNRREFLGAAAVSGLLLATARAGAAPADANSTPVHVILDTDGDQDCDDIGALFVLHGAAERGEVRLLATMGCTSSDAIAPCLDAINTWFGRPETPVGTLKDRGFLAHTGFADEVIQRYPHRFPSGQDYPDAVALYRRVLSKQPDGSVVVVAVGPLRNLANLLRSRPDDASPLDGRTLVARKVKRLDVMGGTYPPFAKAKEAEWNFKQDPASAALVCSTWPTPVLFNGEGGSTCSGRRVTYEMPEHNPLTMAYRHYPGVGYAGDRLSWDPISCLVTVRGAAPWYEVVGGGVNVTDPATGVNTWRADGNGNHSYLVLKTSKAEIETALEDMMVTGRGRPTNLKFNTAYYAQAGMCQITARGEAGDHAAAGKAFDGNESTAWLDKAASSWIQCRYADGRKYLVTSYAVVCPNAHCLPRALELSGSNDGGTTWTVLDTQTSPGFDEQTPRREFAVAEPAKWNTYRLSVTSADEKEGTQITAIELNEAIHCRPGVAVAAVTIDRNGLALPADGRATITATIAPEDTLEREVVWTSSDSAVAEVRRIGEQIAVVAARKSGECLVTAAIGNAKQTCRVTVTRSTLPAGWSFDELNSPPIPGSAEMANGVFAVTGCGHAMTSWWERVRDQGAFVSRPVTSDVEISARLTGLAPSVGGPTYQWDSRPPSAAGLMIRESLAETRGRYLLVQVDATGNLVCRWRDRTGDQDDNQIKALGTASMPIHLRLVQSGGRIQVLTSVNGQDWDPRMSHAAAFGDGSRIGLVVCSGNTFAATTAMFDSVRAS